VAGFELIIDNLLKVAAAQATTYQAKSRYPDAKRDITFQVISNLEYAKLENLIRQTLENQKLWFQYVPLSIYQGDDQKTKNISFRLSFASYEKTLSGDEISDIMKAIAKQVAEKLGGKVI
jgi:phenylalanyl-tRNA synthetase beta subunit